MAERATIEEVDEFRVVETCDVKDAEFGNNSEEVQEVKSQFVTLPKTSESDVGLNGKLGELNVRIESVKAGESLPEVRPEPRPESMMEEVVGGNAESRKCVKSVGDAGGDGGLKGSGRVNEDGGVGAMGGRVCDTEGCGRPAKLQCPTCIKLGIEGSFFCSQECFKGSWGTHKLLHKKSNAGDGLKNGGMSSSQTDRVYNPWPGYAFTGKLRPAPVTPMRVVPSNIPRPDYADHPEGHAASERAMRGSTNIVALTGEDLETMRTACRLGREVLNEAVNVVQVGVTTEEIDRIVHEACIERDCYPSPLNYYNFPKSCCTSVNEVICHGIPDLRPLADGDILNIDITTYFRGFHGDLNETLFVGGAVSDKAKTLVRVTNECLRKAIDIVRPGVKYREVGDVIQKHAQASGFSVVRSYCGHGIHRLFHTTPSVPHYSKNKAVGIMKPGHSFTIEPMITEGTWKDNTWPDNWTSVTQDGKLSAQFEETLLVTDSGCEVMTRRLERGGQPYFMD